MVSLDLQHKLAEDIERYVRVAILDGDKFGFFKEYNLEDLKKEYIEKFTEEGLKTCSDKRIAKRMAKNIVNHIFEQTMKRIQSIN
jgi:hypothetical protein